MQKIKKIFKWSFNYVRLLLLKLEYGKRVKFDINGSSHPPYIAWKAKINIDKSAQLVLKNGVYNKFVLSNTLVKRCKYSN